MEILNELKCPFIINQRSYSIFDRKIESDGVKSFAAENGIGIIAFSPLAQGMLTDKYLHGIPSDSRMVRDGRFLKATQLTEERLHQITQLNEIAKSRGQSLAQMALAWVLRDSTVTSVLIGASKPEQIIENCAIISNLTFTADELNAIDDAATSRS
jgi:L-glyceraldehyde 3-phosphate reductase